jgi:hypothetical protein
MEESIISVYRVCHPTLFPKWLAIQTISDSVNPTIVVAGVAHNLIREKEISPFVAVVTNHLVMVGSTARRERILGIVGSVGLITIASTN